MTVQGYGHVFSRNPLNRGEVERRDEELINQKSYDQNSLFIVMRDLNLLVDTSSSKLVWLTREELDQKGVNNPSIFLGILDGIYHFAVSVTQDQFPDQQLLKTNPSYRFTDIRTCGELLESEDSGIAAQARIQMNWHDKYAYCSSCGFKTKMKRALSDIQNGDFSDIWSREKNSDYKSLSKLREHIQKSPINSFTTRILDSLEKKK